MPLPMSLPLPAICLSGLLWLAGALPPGMPVRDDGALPGSGGAIEKSIPDVEVVDQDGRRLRFYSDVMRHRTVIVNFIYTGCTALCPLMGRAFSRLQAALGDELGEDVYLISVSKDPATDTPQRLKAWGERFGAKPGWILLTGDKEPMNRLLRALTGDPAQTGEHSDVVLIVDDDQGVWMREFGLAEPDRYLRILKGLRATGARQPRSPAPPLTPALRRAPPALSASSP
jgi:protein SCO1/2